MSWSASDADDACWILAVVILGEEFRGGVFEGEFGAAGKMLFFGSRRDHVMIFRA